MLNYSLSKLKPRKILSIFTQIIESTTSKLITENDQCQHVTVLNCFPQSEGDAQLNLKIALALARHCECLYSYIWKYMCMFTVSEV